MKKTPPWSLSQEQAGAGRPRWHAARCFPPPTLGAQGRAVVRKMTMAMTSAVTMEASTHGARGDGASSGGGDSGDMSKGSGDVRGSCAMTGNGGSTLLGDDESWYGWGG